MKPLISYYGGKQRVASKIVSLLPRHTVYVEPFAGGATILFVKPWPPVTNTNYYSEVINDINGDIINLYRVAAHPRLGPELVRQLQATPYSRQCHADAGAIYRRDVRVNDVMRAWATYVRAQMSFANVLSGGWGTGVFGRNAAVTWLNKISRLPQYLDRLSGVHIECDDAIAVIKRWDSPQTLFYCDPPYVGTAQGHYSRYTQDDLNRLLAALDAASGSFVLSGYSNAAYPQSWERFEFSASCSASGQGTAGANRNKTRAATSAELGNRKRIEVVLRVDRSVNARPEVQQIWRAWEAKGFMWGATKTTYKENTT